LTLVGKQLGVTAKSLGSAVKEFNEELKDELKTGAAHDCASHHIVDSMYNVWLVQAKRQMQLQRTLCLKPKRRKKRQNRLGHN